MCMYVHARPYIFAMPIFGKNLLYMNKHKILVNFGGGFWECERVCVNFKLIGTTWIKVVNLIRTEPFLGKGEQGDIPGNPIVKDVNSGKVSLSFTKFFLTS